MENSMNRSFAPIADDVEFVVTEIVDAAFQVHQTLGPGLLESAYEACFCHELTRRSLPWLRQVPVDIIYADLSIPGGLRIDVLVADSVIVEIKAVEEMKPLFE